MNKRKAVKYIGNLVIAISLIYVITKLYQYRAQLTKALNAQSMAILLIGIAIYTILPIFNAIFYHKIISAATHKQVSTSIVVRLYTKSNLYKYLPGNVLHYVGRNQIAVLSEATHPQVAICTLLEVIVQAGSAIIVAVILSFGFVLQWIHDKPTCLYIVIVVMLIIAVTFLCFFMRSSKGEQLRQKLDIKITVDIVKCLFQVSAYYILYQLIAGVLFLVLMNCMRIKIPAVYFPVIIGVYCFAWVVGLITPGAPGGLGVREAMLTLLLSGMVNSELIIAAIVLNRVITMIGDVLAYPVSLLTFKEQKR